MRGVLRDLLISTTALGLLLTALVAFNGRVREQVALGVHGRAPVELVDTGGRLHDLAIMVLDFARDQTAEHMWLVVLVLAASVLVIFMLRT